MNQSTLKRIGIAVIAIGGVAAIIGNLSCANAGYTGANIFEFVKFVGVCLISGLLCWLGGEIISLQCGIN